MIRNIQIAFVSLILVVSPLSAKERHRTSVYCDMEFTVTSKGRTKDIKIIKCKNAKTRIEFGRASKNAVSKLRYKPSIKNGVPIDSFNVKLRQVFVTEQ